MATTGVFGENILSPSTADITVKDGVIILSATKVEAPIIATTYNHFFLSFLTKEYNDKIPPSPLLSARNAMITYLKVVCIVRVQMIQERAPSIYSSNGKFPVPCRAFTIAFITYRGEVPISPKTIPRETKTPTAVSFLVSKFDEIVCDINCRKFCQR